MARKGLANTPRNTGRKEYIMHTPNCRCRLPSIVEDCPLHKAAPKLLGALERLDPTSTGERQGAMYWLPIHRHPLHDDNDSCPWCQRTTAIAEAKGE